MLLVDKYRPMKLIELKGNEMSCIKLRDFIINFKYKNKKAAILYGPTGVGKTAFIYAFANENDYEVLELNASDTRNKDSIEDFMEKAINQTSLFMKPKIILIDELDGLSGTKDRGAPQSLIKMIERTNFPIIMISNDIASDKLSGLIKKAEIIEFKELTSNDIHNRLREIVELEKLKIDDFKLRVISLRSGGDLRAAINDLHTLINGDSSDMELVGVRKKEEEITTILKLIFKSKEIPLINESMDDVSLDELSSWVSENIISEYDNKGIAKSFDYLSKADVFKGRISKWQYWRFLVYQKMFIGLGVAMAKEEKNKNIIMYKRPKRGLYIWQANIYNSKRKAISEKIAKYYKISKKKAYKSVFLDIVNLIKEPELQKVLELEEEEIMWIDNNIT